MKKLVAVVALFTSLNSFAQTEVNAYNPGKVTDGINYFLPKTAIELEIETTKVTYIPGEFSKYADRYLRLKGVSDKADEYWEINSIKVTPVGIPDPERRYTIRLKDKTIAPLVELTDNGIIKSINVPLDKKIITTEETTVQKKRRVNARDFMTEEILLAGSTAKMAELVAKEIYSIRESKNLIIRGQADNMPQDGAAIQIMLSNLEDQEQAMMDMFAGITEKETRKFTVRMVPTRSTEKDVVFRFSRKLGVLDKEDLGGAPVYFSLTDLKTVPEDEKGKKIKVDGVVYNVPGSAHVKIFTTNTIYFDGNLSIAQFGNQETLSNNLFNRKNGTQVRFDPSTGGIIKIDRND